jgi:hypothetical protein
MHYEQEAGQEMNIRGVLWRIMQSFNNSKMCRKNKWLVFFGFRGGILEIGFVVGLSDNEGDEVSTMPLCLSVNRSQVVKFNLRVDDEGMMRN